MRSIDKLVGMIKEAKTGAPAPQPPKAPAVKNLSDAPPDPTDINIEDLANGKVSAPSAGGPAAPPQAHTDVKPEVALEEAAPAPEKAPVKAPAAAPKAKADAAVADVAAPADTAPVDVTPNSYDPLVTQLTIIGLSSLLGSGVGAAVTRGQGTTLRGALSGALGGLALGLPIAAVVPSVMGQGASEEEKAEQNKGQGGAASPNASNIEVPSAGQSAVRTARTLSALSFTGSGLYSAYAGFRVLSRPVLAIKGVAAAAKKANIKLQAMLASSSDAPVKKAIAEAVMDHAAREAQKFFQEGTGSNVGRIIQRAFVNEEIAGKFTPSADIDTVADTVLNSLKNESNLESVKQLAEYATTTGDENLKIVALMDLVAPGRKAGIAPQGNRLMAPHKVPGTASIREGLSSIGVMPTDDVVRRVEGAYASVIGATGVRPNYEGYVKLRPMADVAPIEYAAKEATSDFTKFMKKIDDVSKQMDNAIAKSVVASVDSKAIRSVVGKPITAAVPTSPGGAAVLAGRDIAGRITGRGNIPSALVDTQRGYLKLPESLRPETLGAGSDIFERIAAEEAPGVSKRVGQEVVSGLPGALESVDKRLADDVGEDAVKYLNKTKTVMGRAAAAFAVSGILYAAAVQADEAVNKGSVAGPN